MKKITLIILTSLLSFCGYAQLPPEDFEGSWAPLDGATDAITATDWFYLQNEYGPFVQWVQQEHAEGTLPSYEGIAGTHAALMNKENVLDGFFAEDYLVTPEFNLPAGAELKFQSRLTTPGDNGTLFRVMILPADQLANATQISSYDDVMEWEELEINPTQLVYNEITVTFPAEYANTNVRIAFVMIGDNMDRWLIDDVKVVEPCLEPTTLTATNFTLDSADLSWANPSGATTWEIEIIADDAAPTGYGIEYSGTLPYEASATATANPLVQTPFTENTGYKYYVKAICDDGGESDWVGPFFFSTVALGESCGGPIEIATL
ncbi:MAG TPA: choice-of-anchor J domain-containing protein, partial [Flavobacterium sp.]|nr:choice-of-anchor J domain-containing protein [Flavobacterium sp.]